MGELLAGQNGDDEVLAAFKSTLLQNSYIPFEAVWWGAQSLNNLMESNYSSVYIL